MKQFLRIAVVVLILVGLGFATYAMFFKPANKDEVYLTLSKVDKLEEDLEYEVAIESISSKNFNPNKDSFSGEEKTVAENCQIVLGFVRRFVDGNGELTEDKYSYPKLKECLDDIFDYYYAYSQAVCKTVPMSALKNIKKAVKKYEESLQTLINEGFYDVENLQKTINEDLNDTEKEKNDNKAEDSSKELGNRYKRLIQLYRQYILSYANLITDAKEFVVEYVFDDEMITDRESLLYDLAIESLIKAVEGDYNFDDETLKNVSDDYMKSAIKFVSLAVKSDVEKENYLKSIYAYDAHQVVYGGKIYEPSELKYYMVDLTFDLVGNSLCLGENQITIIENVGVVENAVTINIKTLSGNSTIVKNAISNKLTLKCYINPDNPSNLYFYDEECGEYTHLSSVGKRKWVILKNPVEISGSQVVFTGSTEEKVSVTYSLVTGVYYSVNSNDYKVGKVDGEFVLKSIAEEVSLSGANYYDVEFYLANNYNKATDNEPAGEALNYKKMIKCYNRVMKEGKDELSKLINLTYDQKVAFVNNEEVNGIKVRTEFTQVLNEDLAYLLACCGFRSEGV